MINKPGLDAACPLVSTLGTTCGTVSVPSSAHFLNTHKVTRYTLTFVLQCVCVGALVPLTKKTIFSASHFFKRPSQGQLFFIWLRLGLDYVIEVPTSIKVQMCVCCTLSLEGVQVVSEGVCWFSLLQDTQVAEFLHLCFLRLPLPHRDHHLNKHRRKLLTEDILLSLSD